MQSNPTIAFVHGAFADSSCWSPVLAALDGAGLPAVALPNHLRGLATDANAVRSALETIEGPVVLVGHSYGGAVIGEAARGVSTVKALVFVAAYVLDRGESIGDVLEPTRFPGGLIGPETTVARPFGNPCFPGGVDSDVYLTLEHFAHVFAADVPQDRARLMALEQRPLSLSALTGTAAPRPAWHVVPSWALVAEQDNAIPPTGQRWMAERAGSTIGTVASSHAVMVAQPAVVTETVLEAVESLSLT